MNLKKYFGAGLLVCAVGASCLVASAVPAFASVSPYWSAPTSAASVTDSNGKAYLKTYGVRAGSAGADYLGITNTNYDLYTGTNGTYQNTAGTSAMPSLSILNAESGMGIWASSANENPNPYYWNLYYNQNGGSSANAATAHWYNSGSYSWGDCDASTGTVYGLEYSPDIIFGANKTGGWSGATASNSSWASYVYPNATYNPTFTNNDATNIWTQIYTMKQLAATANSLEGTTKTTRYDSGNATTSANNYAKAITGNLLWIAKNIDNNTVSKKKVAYLYAIDNGTAYFFVPTASGLTTGTDTGASTTSTQTNPNTDYAANNGTIDMGYMATLPFVTDTFDSGADSTITMKVEDIWKANPVCTVSSTDTTALADVDTIIYNTSTALTASGTSGGKNSSGIVNTLTYTNESGNTVTGLSQGNVYAWATAHGFTGSESTGIIGGDDFGTSNNQSNFSKTTTEAGDAGATCPKLYCQRNYTADKNARAAYMFAQVYPSLYTDKYESYAYWLDEIYHIKSTGTYIQDVLVDMTNDSSATTSYTASSMESKFAQGKSWWNTTGKHEAAWSGYAYYNGSSRASHYDGLSSSAESSNTIKIFTPTW